MIASLVDTRDKLFTDVKTGVLAPWSGRELPHSADLPREDE